LMKKRGRWKAFVYNILWHLDNQTWV